MSPHFQSSDKDAAETHEAIAQLVQVHVRLDQVEEAIYLAADTLEYYTNKYGKACKEQVPQNVLTAGSMVYNAMLARPQMGGDLKGGARLAAYAAVVGGGLAMARQVRARHLSAKKE